MLRIQCEAEFEVRCSCGEVLGAELSETRRGVLVEVEVCQRCLDAGCETATEEGHREGYDEGRDEALEEGHDAGYDEGFTAGYNDGHGDGYDEGCIDTTEKISAQNWR